VKDRLLGVAAIVVVAAAGVGAVLLLIPDASYPANDPRAAAVRDERRYASVNDQALKDGDYYTYQEVILGYVRSFQAAKDYKGAQKRLDEIVKKVPERELSVHTYMALRDTAKGLGDQEAFRQYTTALIAKLTADGRTTEAAQYKQEAAKAR
jgi:hypothetical protein